MCKAISYTEQILEIYNNINQDVKRLTNEVRTANLFNLDMLHKIMNTNFNACEGYKLAKEIKENQLFRQQSKYELRTLLQLKKHISANIKSLNLVYQEIIDTDTNYKYNIENKVYYPRVMGNKISETIVTEPIVSQPKSNFIPIPVPSTPKQQQPQQIIETSQTYDIKTKQPIEIISKVDDETYYIKYKTKKGLKCLFKKNRIGNLNIETA